MSRGVVLTADTIARVCFVRYRSIDECVLSGTGRSMCFVRYRSIDECAERFDRVRQILGKHRQDPHVVTSLSALAVVVRLFAC